MNWSIWLFADRVTSFELLLGAGRERPQRRRPVAGVLAHRRQERHLVRTQVAQHREEQQRCGDDRRQPAAATCPQGAYPSQFGKPEEQEDRGVGEEHVPLQRHRQRERRDDEQVEDHHDTAAAIVSHCWWRTTAPAGRRSPRWCRRRAPSHPPPATAACRAGNPGSARRLSHLDGINGLLLTIGGTTLEKWLAELGEARRPPTRPRSASSAR